MHCNRPRVKTKPTKSFIISIDLINRGRWGVGEDDMWQQIEESKSQVSVLRMPNAGDDSTGLEMVGNATGIGLGERIYAARFIGERAYVVTCKCFDFLQPLHASS